MRTRKEIFDSLVGLSELRHMGAVLEVLLDIRKLLIIDINSRNVPDGAVYADPLCEECGGFMVQTRVYPDRGDKSPTELRCPQCEPVADTDSCPKCGTELEENPEDSSEGYCPKCNYGWRFPR